tara:strand:- start:30 stop:293 length:264 start_codon:yes stop_codon:yes gene_type:complete
MIISLKINNKFIKMDKIESRKLLDKHLELLGQKPIRYNRKIYQAFLNALNEAINCTRCCTELVCDFCDENNLIKVGKELMPCTICQK